MNSNTPEIAGFSLVGDLPCESGETAFRAVDPTTGQTLEPQFHSASAEDIDRAANLAADAVPAFAAITAYHRASFLRRIAEQLTAIGEQLVHRAYLETGLPLVRLQGELGRTTGQLNLFAELLHEGSWVNARIDEALPDRKPLARPDLRSMLRPLGPVAIFGASNFPLAFSVAGGDTASALAAGNPVVVKAHPAHPGTSEIAAHAVRRAVAESGLPPGTFSLLFDAGVDVGISLVQHPAIKAIAFTGSPTGGQALMRLAAGRPEPIPCYAEMGSTNPLFILPGAMQQRSSALAQGLQTSFTLGSGQFCTKPGLVFIPEHDSAPFLDELRTGVSRLAPLGMLTHGIASRYGDALQQRKKAGNAELLSGPSQTSDTTGSHSPAALGAPTIFRVSLDEFLAHPELGEEVFGPTTLLVHYGASDRLLDAARRLHGHLTATIHGTEQDLANAGDLVRTLETKVGRILFNGFPTGVEVSHAMVHGGPYPATSDGRSTSVGTQAIYRFARPVCYQDFTDAALPDALQRGNPLGIMRLVNGILTREPQH